MKKIIIFALIAMMGGTAMASLTWGYAADLTDFDAGMSSGWLVQMYQDNDDVTTLSAITGFGDTGGVIGDATSLTDVLLGSYTGALAVNTRSGAITWVENIAAFSDIYNESVYSVVYNADTILDATQAVVLDASPYTLGGVSTQTYTLSSVSNSWADVVPEPATALLFGIGGLGAFIVRRNKRKAQEETDA